MHFISFQLNLGCTKSKNSCFNCFVNYKGTHKICNRNIQKSSGETLTFNTYFYKLEVGELKSNLRIYRTSFSITI